MEEVFKTLEDYPDYAFSNHGRMLNTITGKFLKLTKNNFFQIKKNSKRIHFNKLKLTQKYFPEPIILLNNDEYFDDIPDFPNYKISTYARVFSKNNNDFLKPSVNMLHGYYFVSLSIHNKQKTLKIHRLVGKVFIYNNDPINKLEIDHIDRNKLNNHISNLRWVSRIENQINTLQIRKYPKHICKSKTKKYEYWLIQIIRFNFHFKKSYNCKKYTLEQVVEERNKIYKENGIPILD